MGLVGPELVTTLLCEEGAAVDCFRFLSIAPDEFDDATEADDPLAVTLYPGDLEDEEEEDDEAAGRRPRPELSINGLENNEAGHPV